MSAVFKWFTAVVGSCPTGNMKTVEYSNLRKPVTKQQAAETLVNRNGAKISKMKINRDGRNRSEMRRIGIEMVFQYPDV